MNENVEHSLNEKDYELLKSNKNFFRIEPLIAQHLKSTGAEAITYDNTGQFFRMIEDFDSAIEWYKRALEVDESNEYAHLGIGIVYQLTEKYDLAVKHLKMASRNISIFPAMNSLALTYKKMGLPNLALDTYKEAISNMVFIIIQRLIHEDNVNIYKPNPTFGFWAEAAASEALRLAKEANIKAIAFPTLETTLKFIKENPYGGRLWRDDENKRFYLPNFFYAIAYELKQNMEYATVINNIGTLEAEAENYEEARHLFTESIFFTPEGVSYDLPRESLMKIDKIQNGEPEKPSNGPTMKEFLELLNDEERKRGLPLTVPGTEEDASDVIHLRFVEKTPTLLDKTSKKRIKKPKKKL